MQRHSSKTIQWICSLKKLSALILGFLALALSLAIGSRELSPLTAVQGSSTAAPVSYTAQQTSLNAVEEKLFPSDALLVNVKTAYGAKGDGSTDDTAAIQKAIDQNKGKFKTLYFPKGIYKVTNKLTYGSDLASAKVLVLQGQSQTGTIIKLTDNAAGYGSRDNPRPLLTMFEGNSTGQAFHNSIYDMTFDIGSGNAGAVGVEWMNNNQGEMMNVIIRSSDPSKQGAHGLDLTRHWPGPALFKNVTIDGFDYGIKSAGNYEYSLVFEHLTLKDQRSAGILNEQNVLSIRDLKSNNSVPAIAATNDAGQISLIDASLLGGSASTSAISNAGKLFLRNVTASGYGTLIENKSGSLPGPPSLSVAEYSSHGVNSAWPTHAQHSLGLPVEETPTVVLGDPHKWVKVKSDGGDDSANIQAAFDHAAAAGKTTVYFPSGRYKVSTTIHVHGTVEHVIGMESEIQVINPLKSSSDTVFRVENLTSKLVVFERFWFTPWADKVPEGGSYTWFEHSSPKSLVLKNLMVESGKPYQGSGGKLFIEDVTTSRWEFSRGQKVWARQINPEDNKTMIKNNGADLWILGIKTEGWGTVIETTSGGKTEVLGGLLYPAWGQNASAPPAFIIDNASASLSFAHSGDATYNTYVRETQGGQTHDLLRSQTMGRNVPLFVSHP